MKPMVTSDLKNKIPSYKKILDFMMVSGIGWDFTLFLLWKDNKTDLGMESKKQLVSRRDCKHLLLTKTHCFYSLVKNELIFLNYTYVCIVRDYT